MTYRHKPLSTILAPAAEPAAKAPTGEPAAVADPPAVAPEPTTLPEKYQGKTVEQVAEMHQNAEKELGRVRNEVGTYRGLVSDLSAIQRPAAGPEPVVREQLDISSDDLITDPIATIRKVVQQDFDALRTENEAATADANYQIEGRALVAAYPDMDATVATPEFQAFVNRTTSRQADFTAASTQNTGVTQVRAARRLMEDFTDFQSQATAAPPDPALTPIEQARAAATEGPAAAGAIVTKPTIHEADVIALINSDPLKYRSPSYQAELVSAIKEGRFERLA